MQNALKISGRGGALKVEGPESCCSLPVRDSRTGIKLRAGAVARSVAKTAASIRLPNRDMRTPNGPCSSAPRARPPARKPMGTRGDHCVLSRALLPACVCAGTDEKSVDRCWAPAAVARTPRSPYTLQLQCAHRQLSHWGRAAVAVHSCCAVPAQSPCMCVVTAVHHDAGGSPRQ